MSLQQRILKLTWARRYTFEGLRRALGVPHAEVTRLAMAVKKLLEAGKLRFWADSDKKADRETQFIAA